VGAAIVESDAALIRDISFCSMAAGPPDPFIGRDILNGEFRIIQKIGSGGMGAVYKARQPAVDRMVAVKILHPKLVARKDLVSRFRREARAMSHLTHPNTVKVYMYGELDDGSLYIVMELLEGKNLHQTLRTEGPMTIERALPILIQVCHALEEAHRAGIVHRDLKPENIFLNQQGGIRDFAKVLDFGLAKVSEREMAPGSVILTHEGMVFGTPEFMSPEQARGKTLTSASDIYSLAVILYEILTGRLPFQAKTPLEYIHLHQTQAPIPISERVSGRTFPPLLWTALGKALQKRPEDRFASAAQFADALAAVLHGATALPAANASTDDAAPQQVMSATVVPSALVTGDTQVPAALQPANTSTPLPPFSPSTGRPSFGLLVAVAASFLIIGAVLAAVIMKLIVR